MNVLVPQLPETAPFTPEQRAWLNGFFAGIFSRAPASGSPLSTLNSQPSAALTPLTILYGTQTGTAESLAKQAAKEAGKRGFAATVVDMAEFTLARLAAEKNVLVIVSTYGDGEPPDSAKALHDALQSASQLPASPKPGEGGSGLRFSVCALGDTNYTLFCKCGKNVDAALAKLGASRVADRVDCDLDYDEKFRTWLDKALTALGSEVGRVIPNAPSASSSELSTLNPQLSTPPASFGRSNPFPAPVLTVRNLSGVGSAKEVNHVEFSLAGSGLSYEAGDALGVMPQNCPALVSEILAALGADGEEAVATPAGELPLRTALTTHFDLGKPTADLLALLGVPAEAKCLDVLDALSAATTKPGVTALTPALRKLAPRLYSISSSPKAHDGQVHLTVGAVRYEHAGRSRKGVCSTFLAERALTLGTAGVFVHANKAFRPPASGDTPMIMIGPGTGIAPFRAFLEERQATGARGKNWLFFGDQRAATDFLYRDELTSMQTAGLLTRLDLAFSRDQAEKIYVQHKMIAASAELYAWLEAGAHVYVCGDASRMAKDVDAALHTIVAEAGGKSADEAAAYVQSLRAAKRYQRDVY